MQNPKESSQAVSQNNGLTTIDGLADLFRLFPCVTDVIKRKPLLAIGFLLLNIGLVLTYELGPLSWINIEAIVQLVSFFVGVGLLSPAIESTILRLQGRTVNAKGATYGRALFITIAFNLYTAIGLLILVLPGCIFALMSSFTLVSSINDETGILEALKASVQCTADNTGRVLGYLLLPFLLAYGIPLAIDLTFTYTVKNHSQAAHSIQLLDGISFFLVLVASVWLMPLQTKLYLALKK